jgi:hypothetical protein
MSSFFDFRAQNSLSMMNYYFVKLPGFVNSSTSAPVQFDESRPFPNRTGVLCDEFEHRGLSSRIMA